MGHASFAPASENLKNSVISCLLCGAAMIFLLAAMELLSVDAWQTNCLSIVRPFGVSVCSLKGPMASGRKTKGIFRDDGGYDDSDCRRLYTASEAVET